MLPQGTMMYQAGRLTSQSPLTLTLIDRPCLKFSLTGGRLQTLSGGLVVDIKLNDFHNQL